MVRLPTPLLALGELTERSRARILETPGGDANGALRFVAQGTPL